MNNPKPESSSYVDSRYNPIKSMVGSLILTYDATGNRLDISDIS